MQITELLAQLPARCRFVPGVTEMAAFDQALERGWTVTDIADTIINGVGQTAHSPSGVAVKILRSAAGAPPPAQSKQVPNGPTRGKPECQNCGQPYGRRSARPALGTYERPCVDCGCNPLVLVDAPPIRGTGRSTSRAERS